MRGELPPIAKLSQQILVSTEQAVIRFGRSHKYGVGADLRREAMRVARCVNRAWHERSRQLQRVHELAEAIDDLRLTLQLAADVAVLTGLRMRSMLALTWDRVDLLARRAWIPGEQMKAGRTHGVPLSREACAAFRALRKLSPNGSAVFQYEGVQIGDCNTAAFQKAVVRAKVGPLRWHDLRHTWASWAVQAGVSLQELMELGGWKSYSMVLRYAHLAPDHLAQAAEKVSTRVRSKHSASGPGSRK